MATESPKKCMVEGLCFSTEGNMFSIPFLSPLTYDIGKLFWQQNTEIKVYNTGTQLLPT